MGCVGFQQYRKGVYVRVSSMKKGIEKGEKWVKVYEYTHGAQARWFLSGRREGWLGCDNLDRDTHLD